MEHLRILFLFGLLSLTIRCRGHDSDTDHVHEEIGDLPTAPPNETASDNVIRSAIEVVQKEDWPEVNGIEARMAVDCPSTVACGHGQECTMHMGFPNCFVPAAACSTIPCANGGSCINSRCHCTVGYSGHHCKTAIGGCHSASCLNGGHCVYQANGQSAICSCLPGFTGITCETYTPLCNAATCLNGGQCVYNTLTASSSCRCVGSWTGSNCGTSTRISSDPCQQNFCQGDCKCQPSCKHENGYVCISEQGFLGRHCTIPVPHLVCAAQEITVDISNDFFNEWDLSRGNSYIYMAPTADSPASQLQECRARLVGSSYRITIRHPFTQCGTAPTTSAPLGGSIGAGVVFTNNIWINKNLIGAFDMPFAVIRVQCVYSDLYSVYTSLRPVMQDPVRLSDSMSYEVVSTLCKASTCNAVCPANLVMQPSAVYTVGQILHLGFGIMHIQPVALDATTNSPFVHHVTISCSTAATTPSTSSLKLYQDGCPTNHGTALNSMLNSNSNDKSLCLSFRLPRMISCSEMFIEIRFQICHGSTISRVCPDGSVVQTCPTNGRRRRSVHKGVEKPVLIGPIYVLEPTEGTDHVTFLADHSNFVIRSNTTGLGQRIPKNSVFPASRETTRSPSNNPDLPLLVFVVGLFFLFLAFLVTTLLFIYRKRSPPKTDGPVL